MSNRAKRVVARQPKAERPAGQHVCAACKRPVYEGPQVVVGFLHPQNYSAPEFNRCMLRMFVRDAYMYPGRILAPLEYVSSANIAQSRCEVVEKFLESGADWLLFIDADMTFPEDTLDLLLESADPATRPIVGAVCYGVRPVKDASGNEITNEVYELSYELFPTIYTQDPDNEQTIHWADYPRNAVFQVHSTGGACFVVHRSVLADPKWLQRKLPDGTWVSDDHPLPWFRESVLWGSVCSEDHFFFLKAGSMGYPTFIDSRVQTGHVKTWIAGPNIFDAQRAALAEHEPLVVE